MINTFIKLIGDSLGYEFSQCGVGTDKDGNYTLWATSCGPHIYIMVFNNFLQIRVSHLAPHEVTIDFTDPDNFDPGIIAHFMEYCLVDYYNNVDYMITMVYSREDFDEFCVKEFVVGSKTRKKRQ